MALSGYVTREQRNTRLHKTSRGLVTVYRKSPGHYEVYRDGRLIASVSKFINWFAYYQDAETRHKTLSEAVEHVSVADADLQARSQREGQR